MLWDTATNKIVMDYCHHTSRVTDLTVTRVNGALALASTSKDMSIHVYDRDSKQRKSAIKIPSVTSHHASKMIYGFDEKTVFTLHNDGKIILNQYQTGSGDKEQTNKSLVSTESKLSAGFYTGDGTTFIVAMQPDSDGGNGKIEIYGCDPYASNYQSNFSAAK